MSKPEPFKLTLADVKAAALKADAEGRLGYQQEGVKRCEYRLGGNINGVPCAVGAAIPDEVAKRIIDGLNVCQLRALVEHYGVLEISPDELPAVEKIQKAHDSIIMHRCADDYTQEHHEKLVGKFKALIAE